jgi:hypothetical protein
LYPMTIMDFMRAAYVIGFGEPDSPNRVQK